MSEIKDYAREQIAKALPGFMKNVLDSYKQFSSMPATENSKEFKERHDASKVAVGHIQLLMKLAALVDCAEDKSQQDKQDKNIRLREMIENATLEIKKYSDKNI